MTIVNNIFFTSYPYIVLPVAALTILATAYYLTTSYLDSEKPIPGFPLVGLPEEGLTPAQAWNQRGFEVQAKGLREHDGPFQVMTGTGPIILFPNRYVRELKRSENLSFLQALAIDFFAGWPGFDGMTFFGKHEQLTIDIVRTDLTRSIPRIIPDLVDETKYAVKQNLGTTQQWRELPLRSTVCGLISQLSSRVFLGPTLCRNPAWLDISRKHVHEVFSASTTLRTAPSWLRPFAYLRNRHCTALRAHCATARELISNEITRRQNLPSDPKSPARNDTITWMTAHTAHTSQPIDHVGGQLGLTFAAIHTTTEALSFALIDLCQHPHIIPALRAEAVDALSTSSTTREALAQCHLLDSFFKESQRFHPLSTTTMRRCIKKEMRLADGTVLPKGSRVWFATRYMDPTLFPRPEVFDAWRFVRMREEREQEKRAREEGLGGGMGGEVRRGSVESGVGESDGEKLGARGKLGAGWWQYTSLSPEHMGFGFGEHACPGRFFAAVEMKIALLEIILRYDLRLKEEGKVAPWFCWGTQVIVNPAAIIEFKLREEEVEVGLL